MVEVHNERRKSQASIERAIDFYQLLSISQNASQTQIKSAYHRLLLQSHPDKRGSPTNTEDSYVTDIGLIKEAYAVLYDRKLRTAYDERRGKSQYVELGPRPAQVVSLEEFEVDPTGKNPTAGVEDTEEGPWRYICRCGGWYLISAELMEEGEHLIACSSCSEVIWVGYELFEEK